MSHDHSSEVIDNNYFTTMNTSVSKPDLQERMLRAASTSIMSLILSSKSLNWDDFLDFSKMSPPSSFYIVEQRLISNISTRFRQQYVILVFLFLVFVGALIRSCILAALSLSLIIWVCIYVGILECGLLKKGGLFKTTNELAVSLTYANVL